MMPRAWSFLFGTVLRLNEELVTEVRWSLAPPALALEPLFVLLAASTVAPSRDKAEVICSSVNPYGTA